MNADNIRLNFFLNPDETGKVSYQQPHEKMDKLIRNHMDLLAEQVETGKLETGKLYKVYLRIDENKPAEATVVSGLEAADGSMVEFDQATEDGEPDF